MKSIVFDALLRNLDGLLDSGADKDVVAGALGDIYDGIMGKYRPLLGAFPEVSEKVAGDLAPIVTTCIRLLNEIVDSKDFQDERNRFCANRARGRFDNVRAYEKAGFTRNESMVLLLADISKAKEMRRALPESVRKAGKGSVKSASGHTLATTGR